MGARALSAEDLVQLYRETVAANAHCSPEVLNYAVRETLEGYGYDPVDVFRARYWIRRGRPSGYRWDL